MNRSHKCCYLLPNKIYLSCSIVANNSGKREVKLKVHKLISRSDDYWNTCQCYLHKLSILKWLWIVFNSTPSVTAAIIMISYHSGSKIVLQFIPVTCDFKLNFAVQGEQVQRFEMQDLTKCGRFLAIFQRNPNTLLFINLLKYLVSLFCMIYVSIRTNTVTKQFNRNLPEQSTFSSVASTSI